MPGTSILGCDYSDLASRILESGDLDTPALFEPLEPLEPCDVCEKSGGRCNSCFMDAPVIATEVLQCSE